MTITSKFTYSQDLETFYRFITDPEVVRERSIALGERDVKVTKDGGAITNIRTVDAEIPSFAAKFLKPSNTVVEVKVWNPTTNTASLKIDVQGAPTDMGGTIRLAANGSKTDYTVELTATCKIPLIGGKIAAYVETVAKKGIEDEYAWNKAKLDELTSGG